MSSPGTANEVPSGAFNRLGLISSSRDEIIRDRASCLPPPCRNRANSSKDPELSNRSRILEREGEFLQFDLSGGLGMQGRDVLPVHFRSVFSSSEDRALKIQQTVLDTHRCDYASARARMHTRVASLSRVSRNSLSALIYAWGSTPPSLNPFHPSFWATRRADRAEFARRSTNASRE